MTQQCNVTRRSAYGFITNRQKPGYFYLVYRHPQNTAKHEPIQPRFDGFIFRNKKFRTLEELIVYFKKEEAKRAAASTRA